MKAESEKEEEGKEQRDRGTEGRRLQKEKSSICRVLNYSFLNGIFLCFSTPLHFCSLWHFIYFIFSTKCLISHSKVFSYFSSQQPYLNFWNVSLGPGAVQTESHPTLRQPWAERPRNTETGLSTYTPLYHMVSTPSFRSEQTGVSWGQERCPKCQFHREHTAKCVHTEAAFLTAALPSDGILTLFNNIFISPGGGGARL